MEKEILNEMSIMNNEGKEIFYEDSLAEGGGADELEVADDDVENIDFNNYKGIYADDEGGEKYTCPDTGAHFEPKDLCKRIYKIVEKRKPFEFELYGQPMLLDGVGSSLIADAPYASQVSKENTQAENLKKKGASSTQNFQKTGNSSHGGSQVRQNTNQNYQVPNARAGSMKTQQQTQQVVQSQVIMGENGKLMTQMELQMKNNAINEAYEAKQSTNQHQKYYKNGSQMEGLNINNIKESQQNYNGSGAVNPQSKIIQKPNISNEEHCMSSSLLSEKLDNRNIANFTSGNLQRVKFKNKFGEIQIQQAQQQNNGSIQNHQKSQNSKSPQKNNRLQTQPADSNHQNKLHSNNIESQKANLSQLAQQQNQLKVMSGQLGASQQQNSRNLIGGSNNPVNQSHSMHTMMQNNKNLQKQYANGSQNGQNIINQKSLSIGGNAFNSGQQNQVAMGLQTLSQLQGQSRQQQQASKGIPSRMSTAGGGVTIGNKQMQTLNQQQNSKRAQSQGQNLTQSQTRYQQSKNNDRLQQSQLGQKQNEANQKKTVNNQGAQKHENNEIQEEQEVQQKPKDAYTLIQEQQRAEQAKQPQNQFEHQENILKQLNSDEVYEKLMKIFQERELLYSQMEQEKKNNPNIRESSICSTNQLVSTMKQPQKNQSAEPVIRGHQINPLSAGPQLTVSTLNTNMNHPYQHQIVDISNQNQPINGFPQNQEQQIASQQIPLKQQTNNYVAGQNIQQSQQLKFQQYVISNQQQNQLHNLHQQQTQIQNSRNQVLKNGLGGRLNTKNTNLSMNTGGSIGGRVNTHQSFSGVGLSNLKQNLNKSIQLNNNTVAMNNQNSGSALATSQSQIASIAQTAVRKDLGGTKSGNVSGMNNYLVNSNNQQSTISGSSKLTKKKAQNLSSNSHSNNHNFNINYNQNQQNTQSKALGTVSNAENTLAIQNKTHQSQISLNIVNDGSQQQNFGNGINYLKNSFYGANNQSQQAAGGSTNNSYTATNHSGRKQSNNAHRQSITQNKVQGVNENNFGNNSGSIGNEDLNSNILKVSQSNNIQIPSKNDIIAKYMKAVNNNGNAITQQQITQQQMTTTQPSLSNNKARQSSGANSNNFANPNQVAAQGSNNGLISQYNNFMKSMANHQNLKNPILAQSGNNLQGGHSRNYQNNLGTSSKTHTESMIYNNNSSITMGGGSSFNHGISTNNNQNSIQGATRATQNKTLHGGMTGSHSSITGGINTVTQSTFQGGNRPASSYSGKTLASKKKNNMSDPQYHLAYQQQQQLQLSQINGERSYGQLKQQKNGSSLQTNGFQNTFGQQNHHIINQSLKPKMIMNNLNQQNKSVSGGSEFQAQQNIMINNQNNENSNTGDIQVSNISITNTGRPQSSKLMKKKPAGPVQQQQHSQSQYQKSEIQNQLSSEYQGQQYNNSQMAKGNNQNMNSQYSNYQPLSSQQNAQYPQQQKTQQLMSNQIQYAAPNPQQSIHTATMQQMSQKSKQQQYFGANPSQ